MDSMHRSLARVAVCDAEAFYPFRALVQGPLFDAGSFARIERFIRGVVLHDEMAMELEPHPDPGEVEDDRPLPRNVVVAYGPTLNGYEEIVRSQVGEWSEPTSTLSDQLLQLAAHFSEAGPGNVYYKAHLDFIGRLLDVVRSGGSVICDGRVGDAAIGIATQVPTELFADLDRDWAEYVRSADAGDVGLIIPPLLTIVLHRAASREAIPEVVRDLRDELAEARRKIWSLVDRLRTVQTLQEAHDIGRELRAASAMMSPKTEASDPPVRVFWDLFGAAAEGALDGAAAGGDPIRGAASAVVRAAVVKAVRSGKRLTATVFRRGAFDLGRRVRRDLLRAEPPLAVLARLLSDAERERLGVV